MAIISNFELLYKPIAPVVGPAAEIGRVAVQGYFLEISNLENRDITLIFRTRTSVRENPPNIINTEFTSTNNIVVYDITEDNNIETTMTSAGEQIAGKQLGHFVNCLPLPAGQTASLAILPDVRNLFANPTADLAIRGYTELLLSSNIASINPLTFSDPLSAKVLVSAEHRGTFIDPAFDPSDFSIQTGLDFDQLAYSLLTANGKALQLINTHAPSTSPFQNLLTSDALSGILVAGVTDLALDPNIDSIPTSVSSNTTELALSSLSDALSNETNSSTRSLLIKLGSTPVKISYSIKNGKYIIEKKSAAKAINLLMRRNKISKELIDPKNVIRTLNKALSGDTRADTAIRKMLNILIK